MASGKSGDSSNPMPSPSRVRSRKYLVYEYDKYKLKKELAHKKDLLKFVLYIQSQLKKKCKLLLKLKDELKYFKKNHKSKKKDVATQTTEGEDNKGSKELKPSGSSNSESLWNTNDENKDLSLAEQVKQAAENALTQSGMVYEPTSGMYYDYNSGYYYNPENGLYYHSTTGCYYYYDRENNTFSYHSHADPNEFPTLENDERLRKKKAKSKKKRKATDENGTESTDRDAKSKKSKSVNENDVINLDEDSDDVSSKSKNRSVNDKKSKDSKRRENAKIDMFKDDHSDDVSKSGKLSDGECSSTDSSEFDSDSSFESIAIKHPPCMRIIVNETSANIKVGSLFLLTKEGGTLGREGSHHSILIPEENISRHHLSFNFDLEKNSYFVKDVGSRNGTLLNGKKISESKTESDLLEVVHGSTIQVGNTKLSCHIHKGNFTCGHCEPGLLIKDSPPRVVSVPKPVNLRTLHKKELHRLKEKYKLKPHDAEGSQKNLLPEGYEDKAQIRREKVGSSHSSDKTEQASLDTSISSENKGFKMLQKMGWSKGDGLGKEAQGTTEPVPLVANEGTAGLGMPAAFAALSTVKPGGEGTAWKRNNVWLSTKQRFDKASTSSVFKLDESDEGEEANENP